MSKLVIDLGSTYTKIYICGADVVLHEPSLIAIKGTNYKKAVAGVDAEKLIGKTNDDFTFINPIEKGQVVSEKALLTMLSVFLNKINVNSRFTSVLVSANVGATRSNLKKIENVFNNLKIYNVSFVISPTLALVKLKPFTKSDKTCFIVDLGGGQTTVCALSYNGVIAGISAEFGGNDLTDMIVKHVENTLGLIISFKQAEELKLSLSGLNEEDETKTVVSGKDSLTGRTRSMFISAYQIQKPITEYADKILELIKLILNKLPQETIAETIKDGIYVLGGGNNVYELEDYLTVPLDIKINCLPEGDLYSVMGGGIILKDKKLLKKFKLNTL